MREPKHPQSLKPEEWKEAAANKAMNVNYGPQPTQTILDEADVDLSVYETTGMFNKEYRSFAKVKQQNELPIGAEAFNRLSPVPNTPDGIDLGDGRVLHIQTWRPDGNKEFLIGGLIGLPIAVTGYITLKEEKVDESKS